jgi:AraC family transcriptional regulator
VTHKGPFENLADTYGWLACDFIPRIARTPRKAASLELYLTHPLQTPPEELLTDVLIPLEPHAGDAKP